MEGRPFESRVCTSGVTEGGGGGVDDGRYESVRRLRLVGVGLVGGGLALGALSYVVPPVLLAGVVALVALVVHFEFSSEETVVDLGPAIGLVGVLLFVEATVDVGWFGALELAALVVAGGAFEVLFAPWLVRLAAAGE